MIGAEVEGVMDVDSLTLEPSQLEIADYFEGLMYF